MPDLKFRSPPRTAGTISVVDRSAIRWSRMPYSDRRVSGEPPLPIVLAIPFGLLIWVLPLMGCTGSSVDAEPGRLADSQASAAADSSLSAEQPTDSDLPDQKLTVEEISALIAQGDYEQADAVIRSMLSGDPGNASLLFMAARSAHDQGRLDEAIESLRLIPPGHAEAGFPAMGQTADWLLEADRLAEAEAAFDAMLKQYGDLVPVHRRLADVLNSQSRRVEAAEHINALIRLGDVTEKELLSLTTLSVPYHDELRDDAYSTVSNESPQRQTVNMRDLAAAKEKLVQGDLGSAKALVARLRQEFPQSAPVAALEGRVYEALQSDEELQRWRTTLPAGIRQEAEYWTAIGAWMLRSGKPEAAIRSFCEAIKLDATDRVAYQRLSEALAGVGEIESAERIAARKSLLDDAWQLALNVGLNRTTRIADMEALAEKLDLLGRPWEAVSWRMVLAHESGRLEEALPSLMQTRQTLAQSDAGATTPDLLCGIDPARWPLPEEPGTSMESPANRVAGREIRLPSRKHSIVMVDVAAAIGVHFRYHNNRELDPKRVRMSQVNGGGIAALDYDRDGWCDLYFCDAGGRPQDSNDSYPNQLYRNLEGGEMVEVAPESATDDRSYGAGVTTADLNQDGFADLIVANIGENVIFVNNGDGTFARQVIEGSEGWTSGCVCGDLDGDGLPEMVEINYIEDASAFTTECWGEGFDCSPRIFGCGQDRFLKRDDQGRWGRMESVNSDHQKPNYGFAGMIANFDRQHGNDLFIANDTTDNHFWVSREDNRTGGFLLDNLAEMRGCAAGDLAQTQGCMGIAGGDFNHDGLLDLCVTNYWQQPSNLFLQRSPGFFTDSASQFGIADASRPTVGFGIQAADLDRDGWLDLTVLNGHVFDPAENGTPQIPFQMLPQLFQGGPAGFEWVEHPETEHAALPSPDFWTQPTLGRTLVRMDWNGDGRPDLVANSLDASVAVLENRTQTGHWLRLDLVGTTSERDAIGAEVIVHCGDDEFHSWVVAGGFMGANESTIDIGLGAYGHIDQVQVHWPSGTIQSFANVAADASYLVIESEERLHVR